MRKALRRQAVAGLLRGERLLFGGVTASDVKAKLKPIDNGRTQSIS